MKKLIFAIATVFCLQLGLVLYTAIESSNSVSEADLAAVMVPPERAVEPPPPPHFGNGADAAVFDLVAVPRRAVSPPARTSARVEKRRFDSNRIDREPVVILYSRKGALTAPDADVVTRTVALTGQPTMARLATRPREKRSFLTKAQPVVRKPYDWLKAFASKLK